MTDAEAKRWNQLRNGQLLGTKFRRQVPMGSFVADFCCRHPKLVVEVHGSQHTERATQDASRTRVLAERGYTVLLFWDNEVVQDIDAVLEAIVGEVTQRTRRPHPPLCHAEMTRGRGQTAASRLRRHRD
jgi:very-short-patch-repair endonuclease